MSKSPAYDPQRQEVYRMEKKGLFGLNRTRLTRAEHRHLLSLGCAKFGIKPPRLLYKPGKAWAGLYVSAPVPSITMSTTYVGGLSAMTLLHELAHHIVYCCDLTDRLAPHGPEFVGVYGDLMECMGFIPFGSWELLTEQFRIARFDTGLMTPAQVMDAIKKRAAEAAPKSPPKS